MNYWVWYLKNRNHLIEHFDVFRNKLNQHLALFGSHKSEHFKAFTAKYTLHAIYAFRKLQKMQFSICLPSRATPILYPQPRPPLRRGSVK